MLKNTKNNSTKPTSGYDRMEFYIDFVHVLLSAFMLGYVIGKKKKIGGKKMQNLKIKMLSVAMAALTKLAVACL